jgi:hypothetical protein
LTVAIHDRYQVLTVLSEKLLLVGKAKLTQKGISADNLPNSECNIRGKPRGELKTAADQRT